MVAEITGLSFEHFDFDEYFSSKTLEQILLKKYPELKKSNFQLAVNQQIADAEIALKNGDEVALLPPFAGG